MDLSGIIFVVLALAWALYLIPRALKHHDEVARTRSIDRFSTAMHVLARREPVNGRDTRLVVTPARSAPRMLLPSQPVATVAVMAASTPAPGVGPGVRRSGPRPAPSQRAAARAAAKRRRRILIVLVVAALAVCGVAAFGHLPWWSVGIPGGLSLGYLFLCRHQVRRTDRASATVPLEGAAEEPVVQARRGVRVEAPYGVRRDPAGRGVPPADDDRAEEDTVGLSTVAVGAALAASSVEEADAAASAVAVNAGDGESLWDPLPITLPTYVTKPRATRTVRTIDLSQPGTWSSGRSDADSQLVEESTAASGVAPAAGDGQRAVGS